VSSAQPADDRNYTFVANSHTAQLKKISK